MGIGRRVSDWKIKNPGKIPDCAKKLAFQVLRATQSARCLPDYCIFGAQKSGTTSLYSYLALHPNVKPSYVKEIHYYNQHHEKGVKWYRAHFPVGSVDRNRRDFITGEASTMYLHDPEVPERMFRDVPKVKLLLVLRNPVDRAISHFHHRIRTGREVRDQKIAFQEALEKAERDTFDPGSETDYLAYGRYAIYLQRWLSIFPKEQFLVLQAEALFEDPHAAFEKVSEFLQIRFVDPEVDRKFNVGNYLNQSDQSLRHSLRDYFEPFNRQLYELDLVDFEW